MRVALDSTSLYGPRTGIGTFCREVLTGLADRPDIEPVAFAVTWRGRGQLADLVPSGVRAAQRPMAAQVLRKAWLRGDHPSIEWWTGTVDVVHGPNFVVPPARRAAEVVTVHDLSPIHYPDIVNPDTHDYGPLVARAVARGAWVHAPSAFVAAEIAEHFDVDPERVVAVHEGVAPIAPAAPGTDAASGQALAGGDRYVLALGMVEPRKNLPALVAAFDSVAASDPELRLVLAGPDGHGSPALVDAIERARHRDRVTRLGWVDPEQRAALLRGASVFAYPSRYEGFGFPPLEAQQAGTAVLTTDAGALPEVAGTGARYVRGSGDGSQLIADLAHALADLLADEAQRAELIEAGHRNVSRFSWPAAIDGLVELYQRAIDAR